MQWEVPPMRMSRSILPRRPSLSHPVGLRPSVIPLTIVCGPPASGKTTYVKQHADPADLVIDLDEIGVRLSGGNGHDWSRNYLGTALSERNRYLHAISKPCSWPAAWFIVGAPRQKERQWWQDKLQPKDIVLLLPPEDLCYQRIKERGGVREAQQCRAVDEWFLRYGGAT
jgi:hypothetical protein